MSQTSPKIILFDIDGTILTCNGAGQMAMEAALTEVFDLQPPFRNIPCAGRTDRGIGASVFKTFQQQDSEQNRIRFRDSYLSHLPRCLSDRNAVLLPGIIDLLDALNGCTSFDLSLLTGNYEAAATIKLQHFGLQERFAGGVFGDTHAERNQLATEAVEQFSAAQNTQLSGQNFLIIGDTPADIQCARAIDATVIAVATGIHDKAALEQAEPDVLLNDLSNLDATMNAIISLLR